MNFRIEGLIQYGPCREKTSLQDFRQSGNSSQSPQLQRLDRKLKVCW